MKVIADFTMGTLQFDGKPPAEILAALKANGFRWQPHSKLWFKRHLNADFVLWLRSYGEQKPDAACWICGSPDGYFRNRGAATPVWCDKCVADKEDQRKRDIAADDFDLSNNRSM